MGLMAPNKVKRTVTAFEEYVARACTTNPDCASQSKQGRTPEEITALFAAAQFFLQ